MIFNNDDVKMCLIDLDLFQEINPDLIFNIKCVNPMVKIIGISKKYNVYSINKFLDAGGDGVVLDSETKRVYKEGCINFINNLPSLASSHIEDKNCNNGMPNQKKSTLTKREAQVLKLTAEGYSAKAVATDLGISIFTVNQHMRAIYQKLGVSNRMQAVRTARILGEI